MRTPSTLYPAQIYNLGNTNPHTVSELVELLEKCLDRKAKRFYRPVPPTGDVLSTYADVTAAKQASFMAAARTLRVSCDKASACP